MSYCRSECLIVILSAAKNLEGIDKADPSLRLAAPFRMTRNGVVQDDKVLSF